MRRNVYRRRPLADGKAWISADVKSLAISYLRSVLQLWRIL